MTALAVPEPVDEDSKLAVEIWNVELVALVLGRLEWVGDKHGTM